MSNVTVVGAGRFGALIAGKYQHLKAVVSPRPPADPVFASVPALRSAREWQTRFGAPTAEDVFDICVHPDVLLEVVEAFAAIGAKNIILPKPVAMGAADLTALARLIRRHRLKVRVASQWHTASVVKALVARIAEERTAIRRVEIRFARHFDAGRRARYTAATAFLPHALQIAMDAKLITPRARPTIAAWSSEALDLTYAGAIAVRIVIDLAAQARAESITVFTDSDAPTMVATLAPPDQIAMTHRGTSITFRRDVLAEMIDAALPSFSERPSDDVLTFARYLPVARAVITAVALAQPPIAVIGAGFFGTLTALEIARRGFPVQLVEKRAEILTGASFFNYRRVHMGYHYPRDIPTAVECIEGRVSFEQTFTRALVQGLQSYYLLAKEGSFIGLPELGAFCAELGLPLEAQWPEHIPFNRDHFDLATVVPEQLFDAHKARALLMNRLARNPLITLRTNTEVSAVRENAGGYEMVINGEVQAVSTVVNASYSNLNTIAAGVGATLDDYQYELCEMPVVRAPWGPTAWMVMDGPFFSAVPGDAPGEYVLYDVELSVLERCIARVPAFRHDATYYDDDARRADRFAAYVAKWSPYIANMDACTHVRSQYIVRMVLPYQEATDARTTIIRELAPGFWNIFSGKIARSVLTARQMADEVEAYLISDRARSHRRQNR